MKTKIILLTSLVFLFQVAAEFCGDESSLLLAQEETQLKRNVITPNAPQVSLPNIQIKDEENPSNILLEIIDEGPAASIVLPSLPSNISGSNKLYNVASKLYWNGSPLGTGQSAAGWVNGIHKIHLETNTDNVGIGTTGPSDKLHIATPPGENALRVQINGGTKLRVLSNGGTSIGSNNTSPPANGLYVKGSTELEGPLVGGVKVGTSGTPFQQIVKKTATTNPDGNETGLVYPTGFTSINTHVLALKVSDGFLIYKAISEDANDAFSVRLRPQLIQIIVPNSTYRGVQYQIVLMRMD